MPAVRIGPKHQVTIPKEVFEALNLDVGDFLDATAQGGVTLFSPPSSSQRRLRHPG